MTKAELITSIYSHYTLLFDCWNAHLESHENIGAFVFLPESYCGPSQFDQVRYEFWPLPKVQSYLKFGSQSGEGLMDLLVNFGFGEEFLVMILQYDQNVERHAVHIHKITKVGLN